MMDSPQINQYVVEMKNIVKRFPGVLALDHVNFQLRPAEVDHLLGDPTKAHQELGWEPTVGFEELICMMVDADVERLRKHPVRSTDVGLARARV